MQSNDSCLRMLHQLRALGVRIAMDDFGTGYSSLSYLRSFPFDRIKIDRSFVREMTHDRESAAIVRAIVQLGATLGIATIAEGVETREQLDAVRAQGCNEVQGYFFGRPRPAAEIVDLFPDARIIAAA
jgi:EAL domain-containing protein (putative c-di-GMP-specific phosphodiesterase class I)